MTKAAVVWMGSLLLLAVLASGLVAAQQGPRVAPRILSGEDIGFRVEGTNQRGDPVGTWVIRINGEWREVGTSTSVRPLGHP